MARESASGPSGSLAPYVRASLIGDTIGLPSGQFVVGEWIDSGSESSAESPIAPLHVHHDDDEAWYVLEGTLGFRLGDEIFDAPPGSTIYALRSTPHTYWNATSRPARYLIVMSPNTARMIQELHTLEDPTPQAVRAVFRRYGSDLV